MPFFTFEKVAGFGQGKQVKIFSATEATARRNIPYQEMWALVEPPLTEAEFRLYWEGLMESAPREYANQIVADYAKAYERRYGHPMHDADGRVHYKAIQRNVRNNMRTA